MGAQAAPPPPPPVQGPSGGSSRLVKLKVPTFQGKDADSLVFWIREIEIAISAGQILDPRS